MNPGDLSRSELERFRGRIDWFSRILQKQSPAIVTRRANDFTDDCLSATGDGGRAASGTHADPTADAASNPRDDIRSLIRSADAALAELEPVMPPLTRPTESQRDELETTHRRDHLTLPAGAGTCKACGKKMEGGTNRNHRIIPQTGCCRSCHAMWTRFRNKHAWATLEHWIDHHQNTRGLAATTGITAESLIDTWSNRT